MWVHPVGVSCGLHDTILISTVYIMCYPQDIPTVYHSQQTCGQHVLYPVDNTLVFCCPQDILCYPQVTPTGYVIHRIHPQDMFSTGYTHRICHPQDIHCWPQVLSTGYVIHRIYYPVDDISHFTHRIHPQDKIWPTGYTHRIYFFILWVYPVGNIFLSCGWHILWVTHSSTDVVQ